MRRLIWLRNITQEHFEVVFKTDRAVQKGELTFSLTDVEPGRRRHSARGRHASRNNSIKPGLQLRRGCTDDTTDSMENSSTVTDDRSLLSTVSSTRDIFGDDVVVEKDCLGELVGEYSDDETDDTNVMNVMNQNVGEQMATAMVSDEFGADGEYNSDGVGMSETNATLESRGRTQNGHESNGDAEVAETAMLASSSVTLRHGSVMARTDIIEEVRLGPGKRRAVRVCYVPREWENGVDGAENRGETSGALIARSFRIKLQCSLVDTVTGDDDDDTRKTGCYDRFLACSARVCRSRLLLSDRELEFGDVPLGTTRSKMLTITNDSDLAVPLRISVDSSVLSCIPDAMTVMPPIRPKPLIATRMVMLISLR